MLDVLLDQLIVTILLVSLRTDANVIHEDGQELLSLRTLHVAKTFIHEGLEDTWPLFWTHVQHSRA